MEGNTMITVHKSVNADSRTANSNFSKESLTNDTNSHIKDVSKGMDFIADQLIERGSIHDHTKTENMNQFYNALKSGNVKNSFWYQMHITNERHHLKSNVPEDVNLIDVIEHIVDCTMAGLTRSGNIYDIGLPPDVLLKAVNNTVELLKKNINVIDSNK
jgi:hypothetical protein